MKIAVAGKGGVGKNTDCGNGCAAACKRWI